MAKHLTLACLSLLLSVSHSGWADSVADPTQPPAGLNSMSTTDTGTDASTIQSVTLTKKQRYAMINGETVKIGDTINAGRIIQITESDVWVRSGNEVSRIPLFPNVSKHYHRTSTHNIKHTNTRKHP
ncbi:MAG: hypothetical protein WC426_07330 [Sulfuriferula sp.]